MTTPSHPNIISKLWTSIPVIPRAVLTGVFAASMGTVPWAWLAALNIKYGSAVPWSTPLMAAYLWLYWKYANGGGPPRSTSEIRRTNCWANNLDDDAWGAAILAGFVGLIALVFFQSVFSRMVKLPVSAGEDLSQIPFLTIAVSLIMSSVVAGVVEETTFRGFLQGPIERRFGPVTAILITGTVFGFAHFTHPEVSFTLLPWYIGVGALYGTIAYLTNSILPGMILHAGGNILGYINQLAFGKTEWQTSSVPQALIWETGADTSFWISLILFCIAFAATVGAFFNLAQVAKKHDPLRA